MQNFKKFTLGILALHFLLMFQTVGQSSAINRSVTYRDRIGFDPVVDWSGTLSDPTSSVGVSFTVYIDPGSIDTEIHGFVILDRETNEVRVEPRWVRNDLCDQFVGVFSARGGVEIGGHVFIDIQIDRDLLPFLDLASPLKVEQKVDLSVLNALLPVDVPSTNQRWDESVYFKSLPDGEGESVTLGPRYPDIVKLELSGSDIFETILAIITAGATEAADLAATVAQALSDEEKNKRKGALRTVIEKILGKAGFSLNGDLEIELGLSNVKTEANSTVKGDKMTVHTTCNGDLEAQPALVFYAAFAVKFDPLGIELFEKTYKTPDARLPLTKTLKVATRKFEAAPNPVEFPLNINAQDFTQWDLPGGAAARLGKGATFDMDYSPNGDLLAVGTSTGAWLYDAESGEEVALLRWGGQDNDSVSAVRFSQDGKTLATTIDNVVTLWDVATKTQKPGIVATGAVKSFNHDGTLLATMFGRSRYRNIGVWDVATGTRKYSSGSYTYAWSLSPDHRTLANPGRGVDLWDLTKRERIATLPGIDVHVYSTSFSADGRMLAAGTSDGRIYLWDVATQTLRTVFTGHADSRSKDVVSVSFSPDGRTLASGGQDGTARLWDVASGKQIAIFTGHIGRVTRVSFGRDSKTLASYGLDDRIVHQWDIATGFPKFTISGPTSSGGNWPIYQSLDRYIIFSPDGKTLARVGSDDGAIHLWDVATGRQRASLNGCLGVSQYILSASFSPDGRTLASAGSDEMVRIWDVASGREIAVLEHDRSVESVSFSPDGKTLASRSGNQVRLWNVRAWTKRAVIAHDNRVYGVRFSPDSRTLATIISSSNAGLSNKNVHLWDVDTGTRIGALKGHTAPVMSVSFSPDRDSRILASGGQDKKVRLWNVDTMKEIGSLAHTGDVHSVSFSADGKTLASADGTLRLWDLATHKEIETLNGPGSPVGSVIFSPDGKALASVGGYWRGDTEIALWDVEERREIAASTYTSNADAVSISFSPDSGTLASTGYDYGAIYLWDVATGKKRDITLTRHTEGVNTASFSPDSKTLASGEWDGTVRLWDVPTRTQIGELRGHDGHVRSVSFSPVRDSDMLASGGYDGTVRLWDVKARSEIATLTGHPANVISVVFSPNGKRLASVDGRPYEGEARLWDVEERQEIATLPEPARRANWDVRGVSFSRDSEILAGACHDGMVRLWDADDGTEIDALQGPSNYATSVNFSPDGKTLAATGAEKTDEVYEVVHLWEVGTWRKIAVIRRRPTAGSTDAIASFSPDSNTLAYLMGDLNTVRLWDIAAGTEKPGFTINSSEFTRVSFSPDGKTLATTHIYGVRLWDVATRTPIVTTRNNWRHYPVPIFSPDGRTLVTFGAGERLFWLNVPGSGGATDGTRLAADVNGDGAVNIQDLVAVSAALGQTGKHDADVNGDGAVNIQDLVAVAAALGEAAAAPSLIRAQPAGGLTTAEVAQWIAQAQSANLTDAASQRGIRYLHYLLAMLTPTETALLPNYPNPFNPETWMPYRLAAPGEVTLTIRAVDGGMVRSLALGHQPAGAYQAKSRAAYWDGRNSGGEAVASGVYFYTLSAGDFSATRKMLIRK